MYAALCWLLRITSIHTVRGICRIFFPRSQWAKWEPRFQKKKKKQGRMCKRVSCKIIYQKSVSCKTGAVCQFTYFSQHHKLASVCTFKYLGATFSPDLKLNAHIKYITNKALRRLSYLRRNLRDATKKCKLVANKVST